MELVEVFFYLSLFVLFLLGFSSGANDASGSVATAIGSNVLRIRIALLIAGIAAALAALLFGAPIYADYAARLAPSTGFTETDHRIYGVFSALLATTVIMFAFTLLSMPVGAILVLAGSLAGVGIVSGGVAAVDWGLITIIVLVAWLAPPICVGLGLGMFTVVRNQIVGYWRPRDRMRLYVPLSVGVIAALGIVLVATAFDVGVGGGLPAWGVAILAVVAFAVGSLAAWAGIRSKPFWVTNDQDGAESGFRRLQIAGSMILAFTFGAFQAINAGAPALLLIALGSDALPIDQIADGSIAIEPDFGQQVLFLLPIALGLAAGVILMGHRTCRTVGEKITPLTNTRGFTANVATGIGVLVMAVAGLPVMANHASAGAVIGVGMADRTSRPQWNTVIRMSVSWVFAAVLSGLLGMAFYGIFRALLG